MKNAFYKSTVFFILLFILYSSALSVYAQEEPIGSAKFVPNQVLVRYTDEAEQVVIFQQTVESEQHSGLFARIFETFFGQKDTNTHNQLQQLKKSFDRVSKTIGVTEQVSLERNDGSPRTIKFGKAAISPANNESSDDPLANVYKVTFTKGTVGQATEAFRTSGLVTEVQPNFIYKITAVPNDDRYPDLWGLQKINAPQAWDISTGGNVVVAVVDSGVNYTHPDLQDNMWVGPNGLKGKDFIDNDNDPMDTVVGHGTHVAGTIAAVGNNSIGVVGVNWKAKIMAVRVMDESGHGDSSTILPGIDWAVTHGAKVINLSLGGTDPSCGQSRQRDSMGRDVIHDATKRGALIVVAAANERGKQGGVPNAACIFPASHPDVLVVSATGPYDSFAYYSNYGLRSWKTTKIVAAPGGNASGGSSNCTVPLCILSTWKNGRYAAIEGTSMATPHVAGLAALILSKFNLDPMALRQHIINTSDDIGGDFTVSPNRSIPGDTGERSFGKRINAYRALSETPQGPVNPQPTTPPGSSQPTSAPGGGGSPTTSIAIWTTALISGNEKAIPDGSKLPKGTPVSILYNRAAGSISLTINRGSGLSRTLSADCVKGHPIYDRFCEPLERGYVSSGGTRFLPLGDIASADGSPHVYTLSSGGKTVSTTIYVTTGDTNVPSGPTTGVPTPTEGTAPTTDPNATVTPEPQSLDISQIISQVSETKLREYLTNLVDDDDTPGTDETQTRWTGSTGNVTERNYIVSHFTSLGLDTQLPDVRYQSTYCGSVQTKNIVGTLPGQDVNSVYLLTAHMDSRARGAPYDNHDPAPGADDNGSGTVAVMEAARVLSPYIRQFKKSLKFVLFSGEEQGLCGSFSYAGSIPSGEIIKGVINSDMIANNGSSGDCTKFYYNPTYDNVEHDGEALSKALVDTNDQFSIGLNTAYGPSDEGRSDHAPFWYKYIPAVFSFECDFSPAYHTPDDKTNLINFSQLTKTTKVLVGTLARKAMEE